jgi:hypothetical protein
VVSFSILISGVAAPHSQIPYELYIIIWDTVTYIIANNVPLPKYDIPTKYPPRPAGTSHASKDHFHLHTAIRSLVFYHLSGTDLGLIQSI